MCTDTIDFSETAEVTAADFPAEFNIAELLAELRKFDLTEREQFQTIWILASMMESAVKNYLHLDSVSDAIDLRQFENAISGSPVVNSDQETNRQFKQAACHERATREESDE